MPEIVCRNCGRVAHRVKTTFTAEGKTLPVPKDECEHCGDAAGKITVPADQKLWLTADANPNEYEYRGGMRVMKDWAQDEFQQRLAKGDNAEAEAIERAKARKRQQAREVNLTRGRLSAAEISRVDEQLKEILLPQRAAAAGLVLA